MAEEDHGPTPSTETVVKKKKKLKVLGADNYGMYYVGFENGGELPKQFKNSKWTSLRDVQEVVDNYNRGL